MEEVASKQLRILIADDESLARKRIVKFLNESDINSEIFEATNGKEAITILNYNKPDIVFLDIKMTDMTGFDVLQQVPPEIIPIIIFVTAFDAFAIKAFEVQAIDFLLKPYKKQRFIEALDRSIKQLELTGKKKFQNKMSQLMEFFNEEKKKEGYNRTSYLDSVVLRKKKKYYFIKTDEILYIRSSGYYAEIYTIKGEKHVHRISMSQFIEQLDPNDFSRINRSAIVAVKNIKEIISEGLGDFSIKMKDGTSFPLSKNYKQDVLKKLGIR